MLSGLPDPEVRTQCIIIESGVEADSDRIASQGRVGDCCVQAAFIVLAPVSWHRSPDTWSCHPRTTVTDSELIFVGYYIFRSHQTMNRGPIILTIDEAEYILDQIPPPSTDDSELIKQLRRRFQDLLTTLRSGAEGTMSGK